MPDLDHCGPQIERETSLQDPSAIVENKNDFPAQILLESEPAVTSFARLADLNRTFAMYKLHICDL